MEDAKSYSGLFIIDPAMLESMDEVKNSIRSIINDNSGEIVGDNEIGKKSLAYPIKKKTEGIYYEVIFKTKPGNIANITRQCVINTKILRTLIDGKKK
jgi:small subunit ribosomal protein S6